MMEWGTSDVIAAVMAVVALGAVFVTGIQIVVSGRQADNQRTHEESIPEQRLTHERRVAHEAVMSPAHTGTCGPSPRHRLLSSK